MISKPLLLKYTIKIIKHFLSKFKVNLNNFYSLRKHKYVDKNIVPGYFYDPCFHLNSLPFFRNTQVFIKMILNQSKA